MPGYRASSNKMIDLQCVQRRESGKSRDSPRLVRRNNAVMLSGLATRILRPPRSSPTALCIPPCGGSYRAEGGGGEEGSGSGKELSARDSNLGSNPRGVHGVVVFGSSNSRGFVPSPVASRAANRKSKFNGGAEEIRSALDREVPRRGAG